MHVGTKDSVLLQTAKAHISAAQGPCKTAVARFIFDSGSKHSYISEALKETLSLPIVGKETLTIKTFGDTEGTVRTCEVVQFCVRSPYNELSTYVNAYVIPVVCAPISNQAINFAANNYPNLGGLWYADYPAEHKDELNCEILIGSNFYWHFMSGRAIRGRPGPVALESSLGWVLSGQVHNSLPDDSTQANLADTHVLRLTTDIVSEKANTERQVMKFWDLEFIGILKDESNLFHTFEDEVQFLEGRYKVKLPWKQDHPLLPDNYSLSKKWLQTTISKLMSNPLLLNEYRNIIKEQEALGIIERVDPDKKVQTGQQVMKKINSIESQPYINPKKPNSIEDDQSFAKASMKQCDMIESEEPKVLGLVWDNETFWPKRSLQQEPSEECIKEMKARHVMSMFINSEEHHLISTIIDCNRFSSYTKLLRVTAYVLRFVKICRNSVKETEELSAQKLEEAEQCWVEDMQSTFKEEKLADLKKHLGNDKDTKGIIRCYGRGLLQLPVDTEAKEDSNYNQCAKTTQRRARVVSMLIHHYWKRWKGEYLLNLREYHHMTSGRTSLLPVNVGDIVTIHDEQIRNRMFWKLGRVEKLLRGSGNEVRRVSLRLANGSVIEQPLQKVYPIEVTAEELESKPHAEENKIAEIDRPKCIAKTVAKERLAIIDQLENEPFIRQSALVKGGVWEKVAASP
eukprot:gene8160-14089_t